MFETKGVLLLTYRPIAYRLASGLCVRACVRVYDLYFEIRGITEWEVINSVWFACSSVPLKSRPALQGRTPLYFYLYCVVVAQILRAHSSLYSLRSATLSNYTFNL